MDGCPRPYLVIEPSIKCPSVLWLTKDAQEHCDSVANAWTVQATAFGVRYYGEKERLIENLIVFPGVRPNDNSG